MSRHRAPSPSRLSITGVLAGTTLGASVLLPGTALGQPVVPAATGAVDGPDAHPGIHDSGSRRADSRDVDDDRSGRHRASAHRHARHHGHSRHQDARLRPMTSGERQYRNDCRHGLILDGCAQFDVPHLLRKGISPFG